MYNLVFIIIWQGMGGMRDWDVCFIRGPNDWEAEVVDDFFWILGIQVTFNG